MDYCCYGDNTGLGRKKVIKSTIVKTVKNVGYFAKEFLSAIDEYRVKELVRKSQSPRLTERILAKAKLKKYYPEVWSVLNISEEMKQCSKNVTA